MKESYPKEKRCVMPGCNNKPIGFIATKPFCKVHYDFLIRLIKSLNEKYLKIFTREGTKNAR